MDSQLVTRNSEPIFDRRRAGVLLHPTSLPAGDLGPDAFRFVDFLAEAGYGVWQTLPLGPTHGDLSPYHCLSARAGNPRLVSAERLREAGWLDAEAAADPDPRARLAHAYRHFTHRADESARAAFRAFAQAQSGWLEDYALFEALRKGQGGRPWWEWPPPLRDRDAQALAATRARLADDLERVRFEQFVFAAQWQALRDYARGRNVLLFGDMPIFVAHDSAEVWAHRELFKLDARGQPTVVAGVPPDAFSATGQRWGNPLYDWERMRAEGFGWWLARLATELRRFDLVRIDHFRGFEACWEIPLADTTAVNGHWVKVPGEELFATLAGSLGSLPLVAEDLGHITPEVHALRRRFSLPGMKVLQFAFDGGADNPYLPHAHTVDSVVYTGTHDNDTTLGWFGELAPDRQLRVIEYLGYGQEPMPLPVMRAAFASVAQLAIVPMQDVLLLGPGNRMNMPGTERGNWGWRFGWEQLTPETHAWSRRALRLYGRSTHESPASQGA
jgi:4-alpha-glucanotransferase